MTTGQSRVGISRATKNWNRAEANCWPWRCYEPNLTTGLCAKDEIDLVHDLTSFSVVVQRANAQVIFALKCTRKHSSRKERVVNARDKAICARGAHAGIAMLDVFDRERQLVRIEPTSSRPLSVRTGAWLENWTRTNTWRWVWQQR